MGKLKSVTPDKSQLHPAGAVEKHYVEMIRDLQFFWGKAPDSLDPEKVDFVPCSLCGSPSPPLENALFVKFRFPYFRCPSCGLVYLSPRPKQEFIERQYKTGRFASAFQEIYLPSAKYRMETIFKERVEEIIIPRIPSGKLLDVGCSSGHFLKVAHDHGFETYGIEPNPDMVAFAQKELGLSNISAGVLTDNSFPEEYFDVITIWDVLEHVPDPGSLLCMVRRFLKPNGWVFAYTENFESLNVFFTGGDSEMVAPDVHLRHYTPHTFGREFSKVGFVVREILTKGLDIQHIQTTVSLNPDKYVNSNLDSMLRQSEEWQEVINSFGKGDNLRLFAQRKE